MAANFIQCDIRRDSTALYTDSHTQDCQFRKYKETCLVSRNPEMALLLREVIAKTNFTLGPIEKSLCFVLL